MHNAICNGKKQYKPIAIVLNTVKGKGVSIIENAGYKNHSMGLTDDDFKNQL